MNYSLQNRSLIKLIIPLGILLTFFSHAQGPQKSNPTTEDIESIKLPPRDIKDILKALDNSKIDLTEVNLAKEIIQLPIPTDVSNVEKMNQFYRRRAHAFDKLGQNNNAAESMKKAAYDYPSPVSDFHNFDVLDYGLQEFFSGNISVFKDILEELKNVPGMAISVKRLKIGVLSSQNNFSEAKKTLQDAELQLNQYRSSRYYSTYGRMWEANVESARAVLLWRQGQWIESERPYRKAISLYKDINESSKNHRFKVNELADTPRQNSDPINNPKYSTTFIINQQLELSDILLRQKKLIDAEFYARDSLQLSLDTYDKSSPLVAKCLSYLSEIISEQGRQAEAVVLAKAALQSLLDGGISDDAISLFFAKKSYGKALANHGQYALADQVFNDMLIGLNKDPKNSSYLIKKGSYEWIISMSKIGKLSEAQVMADEISLNDANFYGNDLNKTAFSKAFQAHLLNAQNKSEEAKQIYQKTIPVLLSQSRERVENDTSFINYQHQIKFLFEGYIDFLAQQANNPSLAANSAAEAFQIADIARGSSVQRALTASAARANIQDPQLADLARKEQDLRRRSLTLSELLTGLRSAPPDQQLPEVQKKIQADIEQFKKDRDSITKEIERKYPDYANLVEPKPANIDTVKKTLKDNEVLLSWYFGDQSSYLWGITKQGDPLFVKLAISRKEMAKKVFALRQALDPQTVLTMESFPIFNVPLAHQLYQDIMAPAQALLKDKQLLISVPHLELAELPLSLLVTKATPQPANTPLQFIGYRTVPWLAKEIAITQIPSVTALVSLRNLPPGNPTRKSFVGFGDPFFSLEQEKDATKQDGNVQSVSRGRSANLRNVPKTRGVSSAELALLPRLADTTDELVEVGKTLGASTEDIFLNKNASVKQVTSMDLSNRKVVMFSTHGLLPGDLNGLTQPALALSSPTVTGDQDDGLLTMDRIIPLKLNADWVVLSACNTASGDASGSESISGLGKAFFFAGARALLVSNWPVDSDAARLLMTNLFKIENQSVAPAQNSANNVSNVKALSLQQSMLNMINHDGLMEGTVMKFSYAHPLFWAPFVMVGD